jgi:hypothetical protein
VLFLADGKEDYVSSKKGRRLKMDNDVKYEIIEEGINKGRIIARKYFSDVDAGDIGGFVDSYDNLAQDGDCWVYDDAVVTGNAIVEDSATVRHNAVVGGSAYLQHNAEVYGLQILV